MKKIGVVLAGAVLSVVMAVTMIPANVASAKVKVAEKKLEATIYKSDTEVIKVEADNNKITIKGTVVKKKKGTTVKKNTTVKSDNEKVVKVDKNGNVTYVAAGSAKITVTEILKTTSKNKTGKKVTKNKKSTAVVPVKVTEVKVKKEVLEIKCACGCPECLAGKCNIFDGCVCENEDCETCIYMEYEDGKIASDDDEEYDEEADAGDDDEDDDEE